MAGAETQLAAESQFFGNATMLAERSALSPLSSYQMYIYWRKQMSMAAHFRRLKAPLTNQMWSWGGISQVTNHVIFRAWRDEDKSLPDGRRAVRFTNHEFIAGRTRSGKVDRGYDERLKQLDLIRNGDRIGYCVICIAEDVTAPVRSVRNFDDDAMYRIEHLVELDGDTWGVRSSRRQSVIDYLKSLPKQ